MTINWRLKHEENKRVTLQKKKQLTKAKEYFLDTQNTQFGPQWLGTWVL